MKEESPKMLVDFAICIHNKFSTSDKEIEHRTVGTGGSFVLHRKLLLDQNYNL